MLPTPSNPPPRPQGGENAPSIPLRRLLREQLNAWFTHDGELEAFFIDWFPEVYRQFSRGMTRTEKLNLLLEKEQRLADVAQAIESEWELRTRQSILPPPVGLSQCAPRPQRGQCEQEIIIEDDFHILSPEKLAGWMRTIQQLIGKELKVVLRNCRAGSVILTLRGDWRGLMRLFERAESGRLRTLNGCRVRSVRWLYPAPRKPLRAEMRQSIRARQLGLYLVVGRSQVWLTRAASSLQVPRWAVAAALFFLLSSAAWAAQRVARVLVEQLGIRTPPAEQTAPHPEKSRRHKNHHRQAHRSAELDGGITPDMNAAADLGAVAADLGLATADANDLMKDPPLQENAEPSTSLSGPSTKPLLAAELISGADASRPDPSKASDETGLPLSTERHNRKVEGERGQTTDRSALQKSPVPGKQELSDQGVMSAPDPSSPPEPGSAPSDEEDLDENLAKAQSEYVNGHFSQAIALANSVRGLSSGRAWRIIGAAACNQKNVKLANEALRRLDSVSRQYLIYTCARQGLVSTGSRFQIAKH